MPDHRLQRARELYKPLSLLLSEYGHSWSYHLPSESWRCSDCGAMVPDSVFALEVQAHLPSAWMGHRGAD